MARFLNPPLIHSIPAIELLSLENQERKIPLSEDSIERYFPDAFEPLLKKD